MNWKTRGRIAGAMYVAGLFVWANAGQSYDANTAPQPRFQPAAKVAQHSPRVAPRPPGLNGSIKELSELADGVGWPRAGWRVEQIAFR